MENGTDRSAASVRAVETGVAAIILIFGLVVVVDSYRVGARWGDDGPQPGYFPFYVGLLICISSAMILLRAARNAALAAESFVSREELKKILTVLEWFKLNAHWMIDFEIFSVFGHKFELSAAGLIGAAVVVAVGRWLAGRKAAAART